MSTSNGSAGCATTSAHWWSMPGGRSTPRPSSVAVATCPDLMSDNRQRREMAERMALNAPIQGSAADIIKVAMLDVEKALDDAGMRSRMLLQVHDELVFEIGPGEREALEELVRDKMGLRRRDERAAGRLGRRRTFLARRRSLTAGTRVLTRSLTGASTQGRGLTLLAGEAITWTCRCGLRDFGRSRSRSYGFGLVSRLSSAVVELLRVYGSGCSHANHITIHSRSPTT